MILSWNTYLFGIILVIITFYRSEGVVSRQNDWLTIETLAEVHPYIVGLLNNTKDYMCTGTIIDKQTVLTSGSCISKKLKYIVMGMAVLRKNINNNNLIEIASTKLHGGYVFEFKSSQYNITRMHSNIGLVLSSRPVLIYYFEGPKIGKYFASELKSATLTAVGYGKIDNSDTLVLQAQTYHQIPCTNPKWYYCVCGIEYSTNRRSNEQEFGKGAPVLRESELAAITAIPCGILTLKSMGVKYNIFTVVGPYLPWIEKIQLNFTIDSSKSLRARNSADVNIRPCSDFYYTEVF
ncbi:uncharacterized protein LOC113514667 [Galleria mellonella]|uniref:Uncharacterized protein LOC113514667 n=1 Tax=Galleria mellonella TaxID=7137 RepID=A0ABM3MQP9_GALME|nr:uncharacterized protein LOC113514667 [Galleria mellonella]